MNNDKKQPNYDLTAYTPSTKERANIGVAWVNEEHDSVYIKLKPGCSMSYADQASIGIRYTLFKRRPYGERTGERKYDDSSTPGDDDIPF